MRTLIDEEQSTATRDRPLPLPNHLDHTRQARLPRHYYRKSSAFGYAHSLPDVVVLLAAAAGIGVLPLAAKVVCSLVVALVGYRLTFVIHDCSHRTLFARSSENEVFGWICSALLFTSYPEFRRLHWVHHTHFRRPQDPQGSDYIGLVPGRDRILWHLLKPLVLLNLIEKLSNVLALRHCGMTPEEQRAAGNDQGARTHSRRPLAAILAVQGAIFCITTGMLSFWWGYALYLVPLTTLGLFLSRVRSYLEHGSLRPEHEGETVARTHRSNWLEANILCAICFNFHNEHHRWPQVPSRSLPRLHREVMSGRLGSHEFSSSYARSLWQLVQASLWRRSDESSS